ncbi:MAG: hypothetical protein ACREEM_30420 [Blastocatellia bacterium]
MTIVELLPQLQALPRAEKLRAVQFLIGEIASEEALAPLVPGADYPIWSPYEAFEAAATLHELLEQDKRGPHEQGDSISIHHH